MPRSSTFNPYAAWMAWIDLVLRTTEMLFASGQVIGTRVDRMARAGHNPSARDRKEFMLMGTEKVKAANEAGWAMAGSMMKMWQPWLTGRGSIATLPAETLSIASAALHPIHRASTANARRLARARRR